MSRLEGSARSKQRSFAPLRPSADDVKLCIRHAQLVSIACRQMTGAVVGCAHAPQLIINKTLFAPFIQQCCAAMRFAASCTIVIVCFMSKQRAKVVLLQQLSVFVSHVFCECQSAQQHPDRRK